MPTSPPLPEARREKLLATELPDGLLLYDQHRNRAHFLNRTATLVWRHCDGQTDVATLMSLLRQQEVPADAAVVWLALDRLGKAHLLRERVAPPGEPISRRDLMRQMRLAAGVAALLPIVTSIVGPTPAMAQSPDPVSVHIPIPHKGPTPRLRPRTPRPVIHPKHGNKPPK